MDQDKKEKEKRMAWERFKATVYTVQAAIINNNPLPAGVIGLQVYGYEGFGLVPCPSANPTEGNPDDTLDTMILGALAARVDAYVLIGTTVALQAKVADQEKVKELIDKARNVDDIKASGGLLDTLKRLTTAHLEPMVVVWALSRAGLVAQGIRPSGVLKPENLTDEFPVPPTALKIFEAIDAAKRDEEADRGKVEVTEAGNEGKFGPSPIESGEKGN